MYVEPTQNIWFKYRQKSRTRTIAYHTRTVLIGVPHPTQIAEPLYTSGQVAKMLGISADVLRLRIKIGKYPTPLRSSGNRRLFTTENIQQLQSLR